MIKKKSQKMKCLKMSIPYLYYSLVSSTVKATESLGNEELLFLAFLCIVLS